MSEYKVGDIVIYGKSNKKFSFGNPYRDWGFPRSHPSCWGVITGYKVVNKSNKYTEWDVPLYRVDKMILNDDGLGWYEADELTKVTRDMVENEYNSRLNSRAEYITWWSDHIDSWMCEMEKSYSIINEALPKLKEFNHD